MVVAESEQSHRLLNTQYDEDLDHELQSLTRGSSESALSVDSQSKDYDPCQPLNNGLSADNVLSTTPTSNPSATTIYVVVPILVLGVFVANADGSLVIACSQTVASEFQVLSSASWLVTSYLLAQAASQPLYGKLSDIFGRKWPLIVSYILFAAGCALCGIGEAFWVVLLGRAISGIGGAGMTALVSIIITDMVPVRAVATWRAYVNVAATVGRSAGGPLGGWLTDTVGWRWAFLGQVPMTVLALLLVVWKLPHITLQNDTSHLSFRHKVRLIDFPGALALASAITSLLLSLHTLSHSSSWLPTTILLVLTTTLFLAFYLVERHPSTTTPILPLHLLSSRPALTAYLLNALQSGGQYGFFYSIPLYFQITVPTMTVAAAGARMVPSVMGNAVGGLASGWVISQTGRYKLLTTLASVSSTAAYGTVLIRWTGGVSGEEGDWGEVWYIFFGGLGMGVITSTTFVHLAASLEVGDMAVAGTVCYLAGYVGQLVGIELGTTVVQGWLRKGLGRVLRGVEGKEGVVKGVLSDVEFVRTLEGRVRGLVVGVYVRSLRWEFGEFALAMLWKTVLMLGRDVGGVCVPGVAGRIEYQRAQDVVAMRPVHHSLLRSS